MNKILFALTGLLILILGGCTKNQDPNGKVELHLITSYSRIGYSCQIDENSVIVDNTPLIYYQDFLSYNSSQHVFELSDKAVLAIKNLEHSVHGLAFAIIANDELIYTGYFWPGYSSAGCDWVVIDPLMASIGNRIQVRLGYPGLIEGQTIEDKRNDKRITEIFKRDGKLK